MPRIIGRALWEPPYIVRFDCSLWKNPRYEEFEELEDADRAIERFDMESSLDGSGDIGFSAMLYSIGYPEAEERRREAAIDEEISGGE